MPPTVQRKEHIDFFFFFLGILNVIQFLTSNPNTHYNRTCFIVDSVVCACLRM